MLLDTSDETNLPEQWFCEMNVADPRNNKCTAPERSQLWYEANCSLETIPVTPQKAKAGEESGETAPKEAEDEILTHLLTVSESSKNTSIVSRHYFHESLLLSTSAEEEVEQARKHLEEQEKTAALDDCKRATDLIATSDHIKQKASPVVDKNGSNSSALVEALSEEGLNSSASAESRKKHAPDSEQPARRESPRTPRSKSTPAATPKANKSSVSFSPAYKPSKETPPRKPPSPEATPTKKPRSVASKDAEENDTQLSTDQSPDHSTTSSKKTVSGTVSRKRRGMPKKPLPNSPAKRPKSPPDEYTPDSKNCTPSKKASRTRKQAMKRKSATVVANDCGGDKVAATGSTCDNPWLHTKKTARKSMPSKQVATEKTARPVAAQDFIDLYESSDEEGGIEYV